ncbi:MAG: LptF/LptG family permease [Spirochaetales bacterium]|nr:LptF/LptG family permease [Spirochaetales bacterium]
MLIKSKKIFEYMSKEFLFSFFVSFMFFFLVFFINFFLLFFNELIEKQVGVLKSLKIISYLIPEVLVFTFPFSTMMACLMAVGRFSSDNEIQAMRASGLRYIHLFVPFLLLSIAISGVAFVTNDYFMPLGKQQFNKEYMDIVISSPKIVVEANSIKRHKESNATIISGDVDENGIQNIFIIDNDPASGRRIISTPLGRIMRNEDQEGVVTLRLEDIFMFAAPTNKRNEFEYAEAEMMDYNIVMNKFSIGSGNFSGPESMTVRQLRKEILQRKSESKKREETRIRNKEYNHMLTREYYKATVDLNASNYAYANSNLNQLNQNYSKYKNININVTQYTLKTYLIEFHKRIALPLSCFIFIFFSFPVGMFSKRDGRVVGIFVGVLVSTVYWFMFFGGQIMGYKTNYPVWFSLWYPNIFFFIVGVIIYAMRLKK